MGAHPARLHAVERAALKPPSAGTGIAMRIGFIGSGKIGGTLARLLSGVGHEVMVSNSRGPETLADLVEELGPKAQAGTAAEAASFGDVVVLAIPFGRYPDLPAQELRGKVVIDTNNYYAQRDGAFPAGPGSSSEAIAAHLEGARVVKAFNNTRWAHLRDKGRPSGADGRLAMPIAGDDDAAKQVVTSLMDEIGWDAVDLGALSEGRRQEPGTAVYGTLLTADQVRERAGS
jgi:predicted dinucleotide-binding enzyme